MRKSRSLAIKPRSLILSAAVLSVGSIASPTFATDYSWTAPTNGNWNDATLWTPIGAFPVAGDTATFNAFGASGGETISSNGNRAVTSITINNTGGTTFQTGSNSGARVANQAITFTGGISVLPGAGAVSYGTATANDNLEVVANGNITISNNSSNTMTFGAGGGTSNNVLLNGIAGGKSVITFDGTGNYDVVGLLRDNGGSLGIVKNGSGSIIFEGNSTNGSMSGGVVINAGAAYLRGGNIFGSITPMTLTINGGTVAATGSNRTLPITVSTVIGGDCTLGLNTVNGNSLTFSGSLDLGGGTRSLILNNSATFLGPITNGGIIKAPGNSLSVLTFLSTANTYSGPTVVLQGSAACGTSSSSGTGTFSMNSYLVLGQSAVFNANFSGSLVIPSIGDYVTGTGGTIVMGANSACAMTVGTNNTDTTFSGNFSGSDPQNNGGVTKVGTGTWTLIGNSGFNGYFNVANGVVAFNSVSNVNSGSSALFNPSGTNNNATIALGSGATTGTLKYIGASSASTDRVLNLAGTSGGGTLDSSGTAPITYTSNLTATGSGVKTLTLSGSNTNNNTLAGSIPDSASGATSLTKSGAGKWILTAASTIGGALSPNGGTLEIDNAFSAAKLLGNGTGALNIGDTAVTIAAHAAGNDTAGNLAALSITPAGKLDLANNDLIVNYTGMSPAGTLRTYLQHGFNGGGWVGPFGITSATAAGDADHLTALGYAEATDVGITTFDGISIPGNAVVIKYTYNGDSSLDGKVDLGNDFNLFVQGFLGIGSGWEFGDYNYDNSTDTTDFGMYVDGFKQQGGNLGELDSVILNSPILSNTQKAELLSAVPEPASLALLSISATGILTRRRRSA